MSLPIQRIIRKHKLIIFAVFLLISCAVVECNQNHKQRGRGGGGGFGGGSRSSFSSGRSYYGGGAYAAPFQIGGGIIAICIAACSMYCSCCSNSGSNNNNILNNNDSANLELQFNRLKQNKNFVSNMSMSNEQFQRIKNEFLNLFQNPQAVFEYTQSGQSTRIYNTRIQESFEGEFISKIELDGSDQVGPWIGRGYFLATNNGPYIWWMKDYRDKQAAGQTGDSQFLIYESTSYNRGNWIGKWFFEGDQYDPDYSGTWSLSVANNPYPTMAQQAAYPNLSQQPPYQPTYNQTPSLNQPPVNPLQILANNMKHN